MAERVPVSSVRTCRGLSGGGRGAVGLCYLTISNATPAPSISSGFFGLTSVAVVVTEETLIVVGEKEGGFGDIRPGEPVVAAYEAGRGALQAKRVEVVLPAKPSGN